MTQIHLVKGVGKRDRRESDQDVGATAQGVESDDAIAEEGSLDAFHAASASLDDGRFDPEPLEPGFGPRVAREFFLRTVKELEVIVDRADLNIPGEFHALLWMIMRLGADQKSVAQDQAISPEAVSRWATASQTPSVGKRRGVLKSALLALDISIKEQAVVPLATFVGRRAFSKSAHTPVPR